MLITNETPSLNVQEVVCNPERNTFCAYTEFTYPNTSTSYGRASGFQFSDGVLLFLITLLLCMIWNRR